MNNRSRTLLWEAFCEFYTFAPVRQSIVLILMLIQGLSTGVGLLFIVPLLHIMGIDMGVASQTGIADTANRIFNTLDLDVKIGHVLLSYVVVVSIFASARYFLTVNIMVLQQGYISFLRNRLYRCLLHSRWQFIVENKMSDFTHCLTGQVQSIGHASNLMLGFLNQLILSVVMAGLALVLSWKISVFALVFSLFLIVILLPLNRAIYGSGQDQLLSFKGVFQLLTEQLSSLKMIKSYASEDYHADKLAKMSATLEAQQVRLSKINAFTQWVYMVAAVVAFSIFFYVAQEILTVPITTTVLLLVICARLLPQISSLQKTYQQLLHKVPALQDVRILMQGCIDAQEAMVSQPMSKVEKGIVLKSVAYKYPGKRQPVFDGVSFEIKKYQTVALVGSSGIGKSTLADLIAGLLVPSSGEILCDDRVLSEANRLAWRENVAYVTQEVFLFNESIRENLSWVSSSDEAELWRVLKMAAADDFVRDLPDGLDTLVGDKGVRLSGGERQRLALARALLAKPQLLILDEATSALDNENELKIQQALDALQGLLTIVVIAHRETTISKADQRIELGKFCDPDQYMQQCVVETSS